MAEGRERQQRDARFVAEPARDAGGLDRDVGQNLGTGHLGHRGIGDQHGVPAGEHQRHAHHAMARLGIDAAADIVERHREIARDAGHHRIGIAERDHAGGEMIAVLVDQALDVALEKALALEPLVKKGGIGCVALR